MLPLVMPLKKDHLAKLKASPVNHRGGLELREKSIGTILGHCWFCQNVKVESRQNEIHPRGSSEEDCSPHAGLSLQRREQEINILERAGMSLMTGPDGRRDQGSDGGILEWKTLAAKSLFFI